MPSNQRAPSNTVEPSHIAWDVGPISGGLPASHSPSTKVQVVDRGDVSTAIGASFFSSRTSALSGKKQHEGEWVHQKMSWRPFCRPPEATCQNDENAQRERSPMKAMYYDAFEKMPEIRTLPDPAPTENGVVIKIEATGLCRSDWHGWMGHDPDIRLPHVPGHELAGTIAATGRGVLRYKIGDRVTVPFVSGCGRCFECSSGNNQVCEAQFQPGFTHWGSFAEYVAIDFAEQNLVHLPEDHGFRHGGKPRLPLRNLFPCARRPGPRQGRRVGGSARLRRRWPLGSHDRRRTGRQPDRHRHLGGEARLRPDARGGRHHQRPRDRGRRGSRQGHSPGVAPMSRSTRSAHPLPVSTRSKICAAAAGTSRSGLCWRSMRHRRSRWRR